MSWIPSLVRHSWYEHGSSIETTSIPSNHSLSLDGGRVVQCGWLKDRFGVSWQVVPAELDRLLSLPDPPVSVRVMQALYGMIKLNLAELRRAARG